ncbi:MAG: O-antigen ligase family protein [Candidatus Edwardsbacteria bacterium]
MTRREKRAMMFTLNRAQAGNIGRILLKIALCSFVIFLPISISGAQISLGLALLFWVVSSVLLAKPLVKADSLNLPIITFLIALVVSVVFSTDFLSSLKNLKTFWIISVFFLTVNNLESEAELKRLYSIFLIVMTLMAGYGIIQHFVGVDLNKLTKLGGDYSRTVGLFSLTLTYAEQITMALCVSLGFFLYSNVKKDKILFCFASLVMFLALIWTYSKGPLIGLLGGIVTLGVLKGKGKSIGIILLIVILFGLVLYFSKGTSRRLFDLRSDNRLNIWKTNLRMIKDRPLTGVGIGNYETYNYRKNYLGGECHAHNNFLHIQATAGIFATIAFLWLWVILLKEGIIAFKQVPKDSFYLKGLAAGGVSALVGFLVSGLFEYNLGDAEVAMFMWFIAGSLIFIRKGINLK